MNFVQLYFFMEKRVQYPDKLKLDLTSILKALAHNQSFNPDLLAIILENYHEQFTIEDFNSLCMITEHTALAGDDMEIVKIAFEQCISDLL